MNVNMFIKNMQVESDLIDCFDVVYGKLFGLVVVIVLCEVVFGQIWDQGLLYWWVEEYKYFDLCVFMKCVVFLVVKVDVVVVKGVIEVFDIFGEFDCFKIVLVNGNFVVEFFDLDGLEVEGVFVFNVVDVLFGDQGV